MEFDKNLLKTDRTSPQKREDNCMLKGAKWNTAKEESLANIFQADQQPKQKLSQPMKQKNYGAGLRK